MSYNYNNQNNYPYNSYNSNVPPIGQQYNNPSQSMPYSSDAYSSENPRYIVSQQPNVSYNASPYYNNPNPNAYSMNRPQPSVYSTQPYPQIQQPQSVAMPMYNVNYGPSEADRAKMSNYYRQDLNMPRPNMPSQGLPTPYIPQQMPSTQYNNKPVLMSNNLQPMLSMQMPPNQDFARQGIVNQMPNQMSNHVTSQMPNQMSNHVPNQMPNQMSNHVPNQMPNHILNQMSNQIPMYSPNEVQKNYQPQIQYQKAEPNNRSTLQASNFNTSNRQYQPTRNTDAYEMLSNGTIPSSSSYNHLQSPVVPPSPPLPNMSNENQLSKTPVSIAPVIPNVESPNTYNKQQGFGDVVSVKNNNANLVQQMNDTLKNTKVQVSSAGDIRDHDISVRKGQIVTYEGGLGTGYHSYCKEEVTAFVKIINYLLLEKGFENLKLTDDTFFTMLSRKPILNIIINILFPHEFKNKMTCKKYIADPKNEIECIENLNYAIMSAKEIGAKTYNIEAYDIYMNNQNLTLSIVWQILKIGLLSIVAVKALQEQGESLQQDGEDNESFKSSPQEILLNWFNYHVNKVDANRTLANFGSDIKNGENYLILLSQLEPSVVKVDDYKKGNDLSRAVDVCAYCKRIGLLEILTYNDILTGNKKLNLAFVAYLFNKYAKSADDLSETDDTQIEVDAQVESYQPVEGEIEHSNEVQLDQKNRELEDEEERRRLKSISDREEQLLRLQAQIDQDYRAKQGELYEREANLERNHQNVILMANAAESRLKQQQQYQQMQLQQKQQQQLQLQLQQQQQMAFKQQPVIGTQSNYREINNIFPIKRLIVEVVKAQRLAKSGFIQPSPYAIIFRGSDQYRTRVCKLTEDPIWDTRIDFRDVKESDIITVSVFDRQVFVKHDFLGCVKFNKNDFLQEGSRWYDLQPRAYKSDKVQGELLINFKIVF